MSGTPLCCKVAWFMGRARLGRHHGFFFLFLTSARFLPFYIFPLFTFIIVSFLSSFSHWAGSWKVHHSNAMPGLLLSVSNLGNLR